MGLFTYAFSVERIQVSATQTVSEFRIDIFEHVKVRLPYSYMRISESIIANFSKKISVLLRALHIL